MKAFSFLPFIVAADLFAKAASKGGIHNSHDLNHLIAKASLKQVCDSAFQLLRVPTGPIESKVEKASMILLSWVWLGFPDTKENAFTV